MKRITKTAFAVLALMALVLQACNFPGSTQPTPFVFPTPDLTLTAIYSTLVTPTGTPPLASTQTSLPTVTLPAQVTSTPPEVVETFVPLTPFATATSSGGQAATPFPTNTAPAPIITFTPVPATRPGLAMNAIYFSTPPTIDAQFSEWQADAYNVNNVVFGRDKWDNRDDLSGDLMLGWDSNNLYLAVRVTDEDYVQLASGADIYKGDSLEILMDTNLAGDFADRTLTSDDYQVGISPGSPDPGEDAEAYLWFPSNREDTLDNVKIASQRTDTGYVVEAAIPWTYFNFSAQAGARVGFSFSISDNDRSGQVEQQSMVSTVDNRHLTDPTTWGELLLSRP